MYIEESKKKGGGILKLYKRLFWTVYKEILTWILKKNQIFFFSFR